MGMVTNSLAEDSFYVPTTEEQKRAVVDAVNAIDVSVLSRKTFVKIGPWDEPRTARQNAYLFGWVYPSITEQLKDSGQCLPLKDGGQMDYEDYIIHELLAFHFLALPLIETKKTTIRPRKSTAKLKKKEFNKYLEDISGACDTWWHGVSVPIPTRGVWFEYYKSLGF